MLRRGLLAVLTCAVLAIGWVSPVAAESKPIVVIAAKSVQELAAHGKYLASLSPAEAEKILPFFEPATLKALLPGIDLAQRAGAVVSLSDEGSPVVVAFVPVTSLDQATGAIAKLQGGEVADLPGGLKQIGPAIIKKSGSYAFVAMDKDHLSDLPNPEKVFATVDAKFDVVVTAYVQHIPEAFRGIAVGLIQQGLDEGLKPEAEETDAQFELRKESARQQMKQFEQLINETDTVQLGLGIDPTGKRVELELLLTAIAGSKTATEYAALSKSATQFPSLIRPKAMAGAHLAVVNEDQEAIDNGVTQLKAMEEPLLNIIAESEELDSDEQRDAAKELATEGLAIVRNLVAGGKFDFAITLENATDDEAGAVLGAFYLPKAKQLEDLVKKAAKFGGEASDDFPEVKFNAAKHKGVQFHTVELPTPDSETASAKLEELFGEEPLLYVGFGSDQVFIGFGEDALEQLKATIDASGPTFAKKVTPLQYAARLTPWLEYLSIESANEAVDAKVKERNARHAARVEAALGRIGNAPDQIVFDMAAADRGMVVRLRVEEGAIRVITESIQLVAAATREMFEAIGDDLQ